MSKQTLTDTGLRALKPPANGQLTVWDGISPLGVRVSKGGSKSFIVIVASGQRRTIGKVGVLGLADARIEAKRIMAEKTLGIGTKPSTVPFSTVLPHFLEANYRGKKSKHGKEVKRILEKHFLPAFKAKPVAAITDKDIAKELTKIEKESAKLHAFRSIRTLFNWAVRSPHRYIPHTPMAGYAPPSRDKKRKRVLEDEELAKVWEAAPDIVRLLILWGTRRGETSELGRNWISESVVTIPGDFTKNGRAHAIPILPMARTILDTLPAKGRLFEAGENEWRVIKRHLDKATGVKAWTIHDLRRTFRSLLPRLGVSRELAEILLNHVTGANKSELDEIYDQYDYLDQKRAVLAKVETHVTNLLAR